MNKNINFPHLGIYLENVGKSISIFGFEIAFYGITIAAAMLAGLWIAMRTAKKTGQNPDMYFDMGMLAIFCALIGARAYYVVFAWENYKNNLLEIFNLRHGGLAIYGGVIGGAVAVYMFARMKKQKFLQLADTASVGLVLGQIIGRWGNFFNREAFGGYTDNLFAMQLPLDAVYSWDVTPEMMENLRTAGGVQYIQVHPTFLYESLWISWFLYFWQFTQSARSSTEKYFVCICWDMGWGVPGLKDCVLTSFGFRELKYQSRRCWQSCW